MDFEDVLRFINLLGAGVAAGILVTVLVAFIPLIEASGGQGIRLKQIADPLIDRVNPPAVFLSMLAAILILIVADDLPDTSVVFSIIGIAGSLGVAATSLGVNMRINRLMSAWSPDAPPPEYPAVQQRWNRFHSIRTASGVLAFVCYIVAVVAVVQN